MANFNYQGYKFKINKDYTVDVGNPTSAKSHHSSLSSALRQRGFSYRDLKKKGIFSFEKKNSKDKVLRKHKEK